jgi:peptidoglycan pentaglycine glycine transferase (the first glycine)
MKDENPAGEFQVALLPNEQAETWDRFVAKHPSGHVLQTWEWGRFKSRFGWIPVRLAVYNRAGEIKAGASVLFRRAAPGIPISIAYVPRGPVITGRGGHAAEDALFDGLHRLCRREHSIFLKIEPNHEADPQSQRILSNLGFRPARRVQPSRSIWLDLQPDKSEDALLAAMKQKTRYNIRLAARRGVTVRVANGSADVEAFHTLMKITAERDDFHVDNLAYYIELLSEFTTFSATPDVAPFRKNRPAAILLLAFHPAFSNPVAGIIVFAFGPEAIYMYGASANFGREHMSPYLLQWEAMRWARRMGCQRYDFWGISPHPVTQIPMAGANRNVRHGLWGVHRFKGGFGGWEVTYPGGWDYVYRPMLYPLYKRFLAWRNRSD